MNLKLTLAAIVTALWLANPAHGEEPLAGIGVQVAIKGQNFTLIHVVPETPASKAGLTEGLIIRRIDGVETTGKGLRQCTEMIRGPVGSKVKLELVDSTNNKTKVVKLVRQPIPQPKPLPTSPP